tara:strand:- start:13 stop:1281 length:1269 start_codon:yes stop_codon:yes gene_type:complete
MKDIKQEPISIQGVNVHINNVTLESEELAEYLLENGITEEIFSGIVQAGVTHMNLLKGSIEKNLMKEQVKIIEKNMTKTIDDAVNDMSSENAKYFGNDKKKKGLFIEGVESLQKTLITELTGAVTDEKNTDSAIYKINKTVTDFTKSLENLLEEHIENQNESISDNFDLGDKNSIGSKIVGNVVDKLKPEIELIKKALNVKDALENTPDSGISHEDSVHVALVSLKNNSDVVEFTGKTPGILSRNLTGDHVVTFANEDGSLSNIKAVFESKDDKSFNSVTKVRDELDEGMKNRESSVGVFVVKNQDYISEITSELFFPFGEKYSVVVYNEEIGDLALQLAYLWAKITAYKLSEEVHSDFSIDDVVSSVISLKKKLSVFKDIKKNNDTAAQATADNKELINQIRRELNNGFEEIRGLLEEGDK